MKLLLTSDGLSNQKTIDAFLKLLTKQLQENKIAFIPTASQSDEEKVYVEKSRKELIDIGIPKNNIIDLELDHIITYEDLLQFDVIYVCGGNTFYLLEKTIESNFNKAIQEYLENDKGVYVGVSAGTVLVGPDIEIASPWDDKSVTSLSDTKGLNLIKEVYSPHYTEKEKDILDSYRKKVKYPIKELPDGEFVVIEQ